MELEIANLKGLAGFQLSKELQKREEARSVSFREESHGDFPPRDTDTKLRLGAPHSQRHLSSPRGQLSQTYRTPVEKFVEKV